MWKAIGLSLLLASAGCDAILGVSEPTIAGALDAATDGGMGPGQRHDAEHPVDGTQHRPESGTTSKDSGGHDARDGSRDGSQDAGVDARDASSDAPSVADGPVCGMGVGLATSCFATGPGLTNCGPDASECCCTTLPVEGGTFYRNYPNSASGDPEANPASVSSYRLDKYEVTVGRFRQYLDYMTGIGGVPPSDGAGKHTYLNDGGGLAQVGTDGGVLYENGWDGTDWNQYLPAGGGTAASWDTDLTTSCAGAPHATWTSSPGPNENLPINCLGFYAAYAFCIWDGGFLPSEAEWEYAAAGGAEMRNYAWGSASPGQTNGYAIYGCNYPDAGGTCAEAGVQNFANVGLTHDGVGRYGQFDLGGNVWEYTLDTFEDYVVPCVDCVNETAGTFRIQRGGGFGDTTSTLVPPFRGYGYSDAFYENGVRCARAP